MAESPTSFGTPEVTRGGGRVLFLFLTQFWIFFFLVGLILYFSVTTPGHAFFQASNFKNIGLDTSEVILLAIGETFVNAIGFVMNVSTVTTGIPAEIAF